MTADAGTLEMERITLPVVTQAEFPVEMSCDALRCFTRLLVAQRVRPMNVDMRHKQLLPGCKHLKNYKPPTAYPESW
jgi:hypothetical protein